MINRDTYRMYGLVPYNISPIQQGIQFGHAVVEYGLENFKDEDYKEWANICKTFIILNGGTTNTNVDALGTLNKHAITLEQFGIKIACFYEPDLGDQLTAIVFLVPEQIYNKEKYPDITISNETSIIKHVLMGDYIQSIGGEKNHLLREFLKQFRLA